MLGRIVTIGAAGLLAGYAIARMAPGTKRAVEPTMRALIKAQVKVAQRAREAVAEIAEIAEDAYAEAWADLNQEAEDKEQGEAPQSEEEGEQSAA